LRLQPIEELHDALLQALVLAGQGVSVENAADAGIALGEHQHQHQDFLATPAPGGLLLKDEADAPEHDFIHEIDQPLEHPRLARKVAVERRFGDPHLARQRGSGDAGTGFALKHCRQRLQDVVATRGRRRIGRHGPLLERLSRRAV